MLLPAPLRPMTPSTSPRRTSKRDVAQGPELLQLLATHELAAPAHVDQAAGRSPRLAAQHLAESFRSLLLVTD